MFIPRRAHTAVQARTGLVLALLALQACGPDEGSVEAADDPSVPPANGAPAGVEGVQLGIDAASFRCLDEMTKVRHFFVDNLLGNLDATIAVAESVDGGVYPPGSVVQLVPTEAMVKHGPGWNAATRDWEFFELDVTAAGSSIRNRGFVDVVNRFGGNCFACHVKAEARFDLICEQDHGCDPIPVTREAIAEIQQADPRCGGRENPATT